MKYKIFLLSSLSVLFLLISACTHSWKTIVVREGNHSSNDISMMLFDTDEIEFYFKADSSWYYREPASPGWNKIRGLSQGHHQNNSSARLGYQCIDDSILVVGAYCYVDGISPQINTGLKGTIDTIQPGISYHCIIKRENGRYVILFENKSWTCPAGENLNWGYLLNPYIGGDFTLDHDWVVRIKDK